MLIPNPEELESWSTEDLYYLTIYMPIETEDDWLLLEAIYIERHRRDPENQPYPTIRENRGITPEVPA